MREGRDLETLVAALEKAASSDPSLTIESPYIVTDKITGSQREHDVGIVVTQNHHEIVIALECRDRSRNVTVPEIEAFAQKCRDTGIHKGGIVSSKGFSKDAKIKAQHQSIGCYTLAEAQCLSWLQMTTIDSYSTQIKSNQWLLIPLENPPETLKEFHVEDPDGNIVSPTQFKIAVHEEVKNRQDGFTPSVGIQHLPYRFAMEGYTLCDKDTAARYPLKHANVMVELEVSFTQTPITKWVYRDESEEESVIEAGIAPISGNGVVADLMFVSGSNGINVSFHPGEHSSR